MNKATPGSPSSVAGDPMVGGRAARHEGSFAERASAAAEKWGDRLNPILVKEVRQSLRSRRFVATFMIALFLALGVTLIVLGVGFLNPWTKTLSPRAGLTVFEWLYGCFVVIATILVPFEVYGRFLADRGQASVDLVQITRLSAGRIMLGRLEAACVTLMLYLSAMVPFSTLSYLLRGLTPGMIAFGVLVTAAAGITMVNFVLFTTALLPGKQSSGIALLACIGAAIWAIAAGVGIMESMSRGWASSGDIWLALGLVALGLVPLNAVLLTVAMARTSFASSNKETGPRLALLALNVVTVASGFVGWAAGGGDVALVAASLSGLAWWGFVGFFLHAVPEGMSGRVRRSFPRSGLLGFLLWPGRGRAFAFYVANVALLALPLAAVSGTGGVFGPYGATLGGVAGCAILYALVFPPLPAALFGWTRRAWGWPASLPKAAGVSAVCYFGAWMAGLAALSVALEYGGVDDIAFFHALNPIAAVGFLFSHNADNQLLANMIAGALMGTVTLAHFAPLAAKAFAESLTLARENRERRRRERAGTAVDGPATE